MAAPNNNNNKRKIELVLPKDPIIELETLTISLWGTVGNTINIDEYENVKADFGITVPAKILKSTKRITRSKSMKATIKIPDEIMSGDDLQALDPIVEELRTKLFEILRKGLDKELRIAVIEARNRKKEGGGKLGGYYSKI